jgi:hypothetical protein
MSMVAAVFFFTSWGSNLSHNLLTVLQVFLWEARVPVSPGRERQTEIKDMW